MSFRSLSTSASYICWHHLAVLVFALPISLPKAFGAQVAVGFALGGEAGARLLAQLQMPASADRLLRLILAEPVVCSDTLQVVGVDDWAVRRGVRYGTIVVDLERHRVIDLLADRTADTLVAWLGGHPHITIVARDRSTEYARGIGEAMPHAEQVADRWHLLHNLSQMLERFFRSTTRRLNALPVVVEPGNGLRRAAFPRTYAEQLASEASRAERLARYGRVQVLRRQGFGIDPIARQLGMSRGGVRTLYYAESFPERARSAVPPSMLDPYLPYLERRLSKGCENARQLWREIGEQGYPGTCRQVHRWLAPRRTRRSPNHPDKLPRGLDPAALTQGAAPLRAAPLRAPGETDKLPSPRQLAWIMARAPEKLEASDRPVLARLLQAPDVRAVYELAQQFAQMVRRRDLAPFAAWLERSLASSVDALASFARGLKQDLAAVRAALSQPWSNGQTEGQGTRLKLLKRQMYGRASFRLLRQRVLYAG